MRLVICFVIVVAVTACTDFPDLGDAVSDRAARSDFPALQPIDALIARAATDETRSAEFNNQIIVARVARLKARAARLKRPVISAKDRRRMTRAIRRHIS